MACRQAVRQWGAALFLSVSFCHWTMRDHELFDGLFTAERGERTPKPMRLNVDSSTLSMSCWETESLDTYLPRLCRGKCYSGTAVVGERDPFTQ